MMKVSISIREHVIRLGVDKVEIVEGFEDNDKVTWLNESTRGGEMLLVV